MMMKDSTYLFDRHSRDLYIDYLETLTGEECIFSRNIPAYLNSEEKQSMSFFSRHLSECPKCQKELRRAKQQNAAFSNLVPTAQPSEHFLSNIELGLKDVKLMMDGKSELQKDLAQKREVEMMKQFIIDSTVGFMTRATFVKGLLLSSATCLLLYLIL